MGEQSNLEIAAGIDVFVKMMLDVTIHIVRIQEGRPTQTGSGFIYQQANLVTLFTVLHHFQRNDKDPTEIFFDGWYIETRFVVDGHTLLLAIPPPQFVSHFALGVCEVERPQLVDLVWGNLDLLALQKRVVADLKLQGKSPALPVYRGPIDIVPDAEHAYGFASFSRVHRHRNDFFRDPVVEIAMTFDGQDDRGLYRFKLDGEHKGKQTYKGASGSPIAADDGTIVALVQGGDPTSRMLFGVPLKPYARLLNISS